MRLVKSTSNKSTEGRLILYFKSHYITGWRRGYPTIGKPDFVFLVQKVAVFVDGCFWHGHNCRNVTPKQNKEYWEKKRSRNKARDQEITKRFINRGWQVIRIWECKLSEQNLDKFFGHQLRNL
jgi:DNA mismatch endonuclease (patch repair protein)